MTQERANQEPDDLTLAEAELESDIMDADVEGLAPTPDRPPTEPTTPAHEPAQLDDVDLAEAEAEADVMDADVEGS